MFHHLIDYTSVVSLLMIKTFMLLWI